MDKTHFDPMRFLVTDTVTLSLFEQEEALNHLDVAIAKMRKVILAAKGVQRLVCEHPEDYESGGAAILAEVQSDIKSYYQRLAEYHEVRGDVMRTLLNTQTYIRKHAELNH